MRHSKKVDSERQRINSTRGTHENQPSRSKTRTTPRLNLRSAKPGQPEEAEEKEKEKSVGEKTRENSSTDNKDGKKYVQELR